MNNSMKRMLSLSLMVMLLISLFPISCFAKDSEREYIEGTEDIQSTAVFLEEYTRNADGEFVYSGMTECDYYELTTNDCIYVKRFAIKDPTLPKPSLLCYLTTEEEQLVLAAVANFQEFDIEVISEGGESFYKITPNPDKYCNYVDKPFAELTLMGYSRTISFYLTIAEEDSPAAQSEFPVSIQDTLWGVIYLERYNLNEEGKTVFSDLSPCDCFVLSADSSILVKRFAIKDGKTNETAFLRYLEPDEVAVVIEALEASDLFDVKSIRLNGEDFYEVIPNLYKKTNVDLRSCINFSLNGKDFHMWFSIEVPNGTGCFGHTGTTFLYNGQEFTLASIGHEGQIKEGDSFTDTGKDQTRDLLYINVVKDGVSQPDMYQHIVSVEAKLCTYNAETRSLEIQSSDGYETPAIYMAKPQKNAQGIYSIPLIGNTDTGISILCAEVTFDDGQTVHYEYPVSHTILSNDTIRLWDYEKDWTLEDINDLINNYTVSGDSETLTIELKPNSMLTGTLVLKGNKAITIKGNESTLNGRIFVENEPAVENNHSIMDLSIISTIEGINNSEDLGVSGGAVSFDRCTFTGFYTAISMFDYDASTDSLFGQKSMDSCIFIGNRYGIQINGDNQELSGRRLFKEIFLNNVFVGNTCAIYEPTGGTYIDGQIFCPVFQKSEFIDNTVADCQASKNAPVLLEKCYFGTTQTGSLTVRQPLTYNAIATGTVNYSGYFDPNYTQIANTYTDDELMYLDVMENDWYYEPITYCTKKGLYIGNEDGTFAPETMMTQAQLVTALYRIIYGNDTTSGSTWYEKPKSWAEDEEIISSFSANEHVSRADFITMFYKTMQASRAFDMTISEADYERLEKASDYDSFKDEPREVIDALAWCIKSGMIKGTDDTHLTVSPYDEVTRAQVATMQMRYFEKH